jgi:retron-type reverse transcriptase
VIVEEREDGKKEYKRNDIGTPQGRVISLLFANIYPNVLDNPSVGSITPLKLLIF